MKQIKRICDKYNLFLIEDYAQAHFAEYNNQKVGTFGDLLGGPTELERGEGETDYDPARELINRAKFGTEGALFTGLIGGVGSTVKALSKRGKDLRFSNFF